MLDFWDGLWFKFGQWAAEVTISLSVLALIVVMFFISEWWKGRSGPDRD